VRVILGFSVLFCGKDKGMPMAGRSIGEHGKETLETCCAESLLAVYVLCGVLMSGIDAKKIVPLSIRG
jgi:hypothetical protein